ncbi:MAG: hypothetical protein QOD64_2319, partial [Verrucomicrobiota bacterium]
MRGCSIDFTSKLDREKWIGWDSNPQPTPKKGATLLGRLLAQFGLNPVLEDPTLELHDANGANLIANDNWK